MASLPIANQYQFIKSALTAKKHVLSEKPVAENLEAAVDLISLYNERREEFDNVTWSVAENYRYLDSFKYARQQIEKLGQITNFRAQIYGNIKENWKFLRETTRITLLFMDFFTDLVILQNM